MSNVSIQYQKSGKSKSSDERGMRPMQAKVYQERGSQYILLKAPPAAGKSRALMFVGLDKLEHQGLRKAIVSVPERAIAGSFKDTDLVTHGFFRDWHVDPKNDLCSLAAETSQGTVDRFKDFMQSDDEVLLCTHATLRFAFRQVAIEDFDDCLLAVDEFHHASAAEDNELGNVVRMLMARDRAHILAMTGSYFRGDQNAVMRPEDEERFTPVTYSYFDQLNGYEHLENLDVNYHFYQGSYLQALPEVLDTDEATILHIPNVNSIESMNDKYGEVDRIIGGIGKWEGEDPETGFALVRRHTDGKVIRVADLVDDAAEKRDKLRTSLRNIETRDELDLIIALGMAKEGFDWVWCETALTVGYRKSMTEVIQIIGRATRDAPGKKTARFLNLVAEPAADQEVVTDSVNSLLKAISVSLLMEQIMLPKLKLFDTRKDPDGDRVSHDEETGITHFGVPGLQELPTERTRKIVEEDMHDLVAAVYQDTGALRSSIDPEKSPELFNEVELPKIIENKYKDLSDEEVDAVRAHTSATLAVAHEANKERSAGSDKFFDLAKRLEVGDLNMDLIGQINPVAEGYEILSKTIDRRLLGIVQNDIESRRGNKVTEEEARANAGRIKKMIKSGHPPRPDATDPQEKRDAQILLWLQREKQRWNQAAEA